MYLCKHCRKPSMEYKGQCPNCSRWNCLLETDPSQIIEPAKDGKADEARARPITEVEAVVDKRFSTGIAEVDRVLGTSGAISGLVYPSLILLAGEPGIGKSTVLLQAAANVARTQGPVIYATGEESTPALSSRAERLGAKHERLLVMATNHLEHIDDEVKRVGPCLLIVDSTQTMHRMDLQGDAGSVTQVRGLPLYLGPLARRSGREMGVIIVGHVTKDGSVAGPKTLEHLVDATLYFEGETERTIRFLRSTKNRFNNTQDVGVLEMSQQGLIDVVTPSAHFLAQRRADEPGSVVTAACSGANSKRAILVEMQVLIGQAELAKLDVSVSGLEKARVQMMCAVLGRKAGIKVDNAPLYAQAVGGMDIYERASDLAIALAVASASENRPVMRDMIAFGEVGLMGELRDTTPQPHLRLKEAASMGFKKAVVPPFRNMEPIEGMELLRAETLAQAVEMALS